MNSLSLSLSLSLSTSTATVVGNCGMTLSFVDSSSRKVCVSDMISPPKQSLSWNAKHSLGFRRGNAGLSPRLCLRHQCVSSLRLTWATWVEGGMLWNVIQLYLFQTKMKQLVALQTKMKQRSDCRPKRSNLSHCRPKWCTHGFTDQFEAPRPIADQFESLASLQTESVQVRPCRPFQSCADQSE